MKLKISCLLTVIAFLSLFSHNANAQIMTDDTFLLKIGYIPYGIVSFDKGIKIDGIEDKEAEVNDIKSTGLNYAVQAEYNLIFGIFALGLGFEYERVSADKFGNDSGEYKKFYNDFLMPLMSFKFEMVKNFYSGLAFSGKYMVSTETPMVKDSDAAPLRAEFDKEMDAWAYFILGYNLQAGESVFINFEGRFGYNLTNKQYRKMEAGDSTGTYKFELAPAQAYDTAVFIGLGIRPMY